MPKILKRATQAKSIGLYKDQVDKIALYTSGGNGKLVEFVRQAVDNELARLDGLAEGDPFGLNEINETSFLVPAEAYKELHGIKETAFARRKAAGKISLVSIGGKKFVEITNKQDASLLAQFLSYKHQFDDKVGLLNNLVREYMERVEALEQVAANAMSDDDWLIS